MPQPIHTHDRRQHQSGLWNKESNYHFFLTFEALAISLAPSQKAFESLSINKLNTMNSPLIE